jgi:hypothetical protein
MKADAVAAPISPPTAEGTFEMSLEPHVLKTHIIGMKAGLFQVFRDHLELTH